MGSLEDGAGETVRLFVGTDRSQMLAMRVLEHSVRRRTRSPVEVTALIDVRLPEPRDPRNRQRTGFSFARFAIPQMAGYSGRAIYTDADMIVFGDIAELWSLDFAGAKLLVLQDEPTGDNSSGQNALWRRKQTAVMVFDCAALDWDAEAIVRGLDEGRYDYDQLVHEICILDESAVHRAIPPDWNCVDAFDPTRTRLYHFTDMPTQPWVKAGHPFGHLWTTELRAVIDAGKLTRAEIEEEIALGWVRPSLLTELDQAPQGEACPLELADRFDAEDRSKDFVPHAAAIAERRRQKAAWKAGKQDRSAGSAKQPPSSRLSGAATSIGDHPSADLRFTMVDPDVGTSPEPNVYYINPPRHGLALPRGEVDAKRVLDALEPGCPRPPALIGCDVIGPYRLRFLARLPSGVEGKLRLIRWPQPEALWADRYDLRGVVAVRGDTLSRYAEALEPSRPFDTVAALRQLLNDRPEDVLPVDAPLRLLFDRGPSDGPGSMPPIPPPPSTVTVIIPYRDRPDLMRQCVGSLAVQEGLEHLELVLVDNQSDPANRQAVEALCHELLPSAALLHLSYDRPFNHSAQCNMGVDAASGDVLVFMNNDAVLQGRDVLAKLAGWAMLPRVASVGPRFVDPRGELLSAGLEIYGTSRDTGVVRESKALVMTTDVRSTVGNSFACAAVSRRAWVDVGPLDDQTFPTDSNDADFAIRALSRGFRHVYVGDVEVAHAPGSSGRREDSDKTVLRNLMRERHGDLMRWRDQAPRVEWYTKRIETPLRAAMRMKQGVGRLLVALLAVTIWPMVTVKRSVNRLLGRA